MVRSRLRCCAALHDPLVMCSYACTDSKMQLLKESVALESISGEEYDVSALLQFCAKQHGKS